MWRLINFLFGFMIGAALGAGFMLLTTPQSGEHLKETFRREFASHKAELESKLIQTRPVV
jgi:gas vesicle protein